MLNVSEIEGRYHWMFHSGHRAIILPVGDDDTWQLRLLDTLKYLAEGVKEVVGM